MTDPVALITGSGRKRVGNIIARHLAAQGYRIAMHYHSSEDAARESRDELRETGVDCEVFQADVADESEVARMMNNVVDRFQRLDVVVTTSSIWSTTPLKDITADDLRRNFDVNVTGTFLVARAAGNVMISQPDGGSIVTIGDWAIERPYLHHAPYFVSKGAVPTLTRVLALELGHRNPRVRVNCIHPGPVMYPPGTSDEEKQTLKESTLVKDGDCPETVAHAVQFLIDNKFITGASVPIDGGRHMYTPSDANRKSI